MTLQSKDSGALSKLLPALFDAATPKDLTLSGDREKVVYSMDLHPSGCIGALTSLLTPTSCSACCLKTLPVLEQITCEGQGPGVTAGAASVSDH